MGIAKILKHDAARPSHNTMLVRCGAFPLRASPIRVFKRGARSDDRVLAKPSRPVMSARLCPTLGAANMPAHAGLCHGAVKFAGDASAPVPFEWSSRETGSMPVGCTVPSAPSARLTKSTIGPLRAHKDGVVDSKTYTLGRAGRIAGRRLCRDARKTPSPTNHTEPKPARGSTHHVEPSLKPRRGGTRGGSGQEVPSRFARRSAARRDRTS